MSSSVQNYEDLGGIAGYVVGYDAFNGDSRVLMVGDSCLKKGDCASGGFVGITTEKATWE